MRERVKKHHNDKKKLHIELRTKLELERMAGKSTKRGKHEGS